MVDEEEESESEESEGSEGSDEDDDEEEEEEESELFGMSISFMLLSSSDPFSARLASFSAAAAFSLALRAAFFALKAIAPGEASYSSLSFVYFSFAAVAKSVNGFFASSVKSFHFCPMILLFSPRVAFGLAALISARTEAA